MPFKTAARYHNRTVIKTEIRIPRNPVIKNNAVLLGDISRKAAVNDQRRKKDN